MDRPSSVDSDILGISSPPATVNVSFLSGTGGAAMPEFEIIDIREGEVDPLVETLNLEGKGSLVTLAKLSLLFLSIILCLAVRSRIFFSVLGKYSGR